VDLRFGVQPKLVELKANKFGDAQPGSEGQIEHGTVA